MTSKTYCSKVKYSLEDCDETEFEQSLNNVETEFEQSTNNVRTEIEQRPNRNKTDIARSQKRPIETHKVIYKQNLDIVKLLNNNKFISVNTSNTYNNIMELPLSRAPIDLTTAINKCGFPVSRDDLAKIYTSANVCQRITKFRCFVIVVLFCLISVFATKVYYDKAPQKNNCVMMTTNTQFLTDKDWTDIFEKIEIKNKSKITDYRKNIIKEKILKKGDYSFNAIELEWQLQRTEMLNFLNGKK